MRTSPGKCCCCNACRIAQDKFNRANSSSLGADWDEVVGDFEIDTNNLLTADSDALALHQGPPPTGNPRHTATARVRGADDGDELRVWVATEDQDYGLYAQATVGACGEFSLWRVSGGTHTQLTATVVPDLTADEWHRIKACYRSLTDFGNNEGQRACSTLAETTMQVISPIAPDYYAYDFILVFQCGAVTNGDATTTSNFATAMLTYGVHTDNGATIVVRTTQCGATNCMTIEFGGAWAGYDLGEMLTYDSGDTTVTTLNDGGSTNSTFSAVLTTKNGKQYILSAAATSTGTLAGLGTGTITSEARFDDFCWQRHKTRASEYDDYGSEIDATCPECATRECLYFVDEFDRADSGTVGCGWTEVSGTWSIDTEQLAGSATGLITLDANQPDNEPYMSLRGVVTMPTANDTVRVMVAFADSDNYLCMEIVVGSDCGTIELIHRDAGVETSISSVISVATLTPGTHQFSLCFGPKSADEPGYYLIGSVDVTDGSDGTYVLSTSSPDTSGLGVFSALSIEVIGGADITFGGVNLRQTYSESHRTCEYCDGTVTCAFAWLGVDETGFDCSWDVNSGTWTAAGGGAITTTSSNAEAYAISESFTVAMGGSVRVAFGETGDQAKIFLCGGDIVVTLTCSDYPDCGELDINGETLAVANLRPGVTYHVCLTYDGTTASAGVWVPRDELDTPMQGHSLVLRKTSTAAAGTGNTAGIGTGTVNGSVTFSEANFIRAEDGDGVSCFDCSACVTGYYQSDDIHGAQCEFEAASTPLSGTGDIVLGANAYALMAAAGASFVEAYFSAAAANTKSRIYLGDDGTRAGPWIEIEWGSSTSTLRTKSGTELTIGKRVGDVAHLFVCLSGTRMTAVVDPAPSVNPPATATLASTLVAGAIGTYAGFESLVGTSTFTDFLCGRLTSESSGLPCNECYQICEACNGGYFPDEWTATIAGVVPAPPNNYACCNNYDGTYILAAESSCNAAWNNDGDACDAPGYVTLEITDGETEVTFTVSAYVQPDYPSPGVVLTWSATVSKPINCLTLANLVLTADDTSGQCGQTSSTVTLSAV